MRSLREWIHTLELNPKQFKQPHEMSPEEFAAHPASVFHGTYLPDEDVFNLEKRDPSPASGLGAIEGRNGWGQRQTFYPVPKIHLGTFQAALDTLVQRSRESNQEGTVHTFWQTPKVDGDTSDLELQDVMDIDPSHDFDYTHNPENVAHFAEGSQYYANQNEDIGNPSFATDEPDQTLASHADYVKAALKSGVPESEVHPRTLAQYKAGTLGKMTIRANVADLMTRNEDKLGPLKNAGPKWDYLNSEEEAPKRPEI